VVVGEISTHTLGIIAARAVPQVTVPTNWTTGSGQVCGPESRF
jgi:hypothetical protein